MSPSVSVLPSALRLTSKFDLGSLPLPRLWNGPPKLRLIGPFSVLDPAGVSVNEKSRFPLFTGWDPLKVCLSSELACPELLLLPHAAMATAATPATSSTPSVRTPLIR
jgi:hypothetical protein